MIRSDFRSMEFNYTFKLIMIGDAGVGKTSLMYNYVYGAVPKEASITIGVELGARVIDIQGQSQRAKLHIWDTSGQEKFRSITRSYYRGAAGCLVLYDVTSRASFNHVREWLKDVRSVAPSSHVAIMLVGTKTDLEEARMVATEEGQALAEQEGMLFAETNYTQCPDVLFQSVGERIYERRDFIHVGVRTNHIRPPIGPPPHSSTLSEKCCLSFS